MDPENEVQDQVETPRRTDEDDLETGLADSQGKRKPGEKQTTPKKATKVDPSSPIGTHTTEYVDTAGSVDQTRLSMRLDQTQVDAQARFAF